MQMASHLCEFVYEYLKHLGPNIYIHIDCIEIIFRLNEFVCVFRTGRDRQGNRDISIKKKVNLIRKIKKFSYTRLYSSFKVTHKIIKLKFVNKFREICSKMSGSTANPHQATFLILKIKDSRHS